MTQTSANPQLAEILRAHGVAMQEEGDWLRVSPGGPHLHAVFIEMRSEPGVSMWQLDVHLEPWTGRRIIESVAGFGTTEQEAWHDALTNFVRASLHVLLAAFIQPADAHVIVETWQVGGIQRKVILGEVVSRGSAAPSPDEPWLAAFKNALQSLPLASGTHWVRVFFAQQEGARTTLEVLLDNEPWQALAELLDIAPWPSAPGFLSRRLFLVLQGGVDVSLVVAAWFDVPEEDSPMDFLQERGMTRLEAEKLYAYLPLAFGDPLLRRMGSASPPSVEFTSDPPTVQQVLQVDEDPHWRDSVQLAEQAFRGNTGLTREQLSQLATSGSTFRVLNQLLGDDSDARHIVFTPPLMILSEEAMSQWPTGAPAAPPPPSPAPASLAPAAPAKKPWWKVW